MSLLLFSCVIDVLTEEVRRKEGSRCLLYADNIVLVAELKQSHGMVPRMETGHKNQGTENK